MKFSFHLLALCSALCSALLGATGAHADEKADFLQSLAVPLSRAETRQYDALFQALKTATAAFEARGAVSVSFGIDARGMMTVIVTSSYAGRTQNATVHAWKGSQFAPASASN